MARKRVEYYYPDRHTIININNFQERAVRAHLNSLLERQLDENWNPLITASCKSTYMRKMELEHIGLIGAAFVTKEDVFVEKVYQTEISYLSLSFSIDIFYHLKIYLIISIRKQIHPPPFCFG